MRNVLKAKFYRVIPLYLLIAMTGACRRKQPQAEPTPPTDRDRARVAEEMMIGERIYRKDMMAARATDAALSMGILPNDSRVEGWVVDGKTDPPALYLMGAVAGEPRSYHIFIFAKKTRRPQYKKANPEITTERQQAMYRARESALASLAFECADLGYNTVVIEDEKRWIVYVLAATAQPDMVIAGGHHRITVCKNTGRRLKVEPLSKTCIRIPLPPDRNSSGIILTQPGLRLPHAMHGYLSRLHKRPLLVVTETGVWRIEQGEATPAWPKETDRKKP